MDNKLKEKIDLLTGLSDWYIKSPLRENNCLVVNDGPCGLRKPFERREGYEAMPATTFPAPSAVACSFDKEVARRVGEGIAKECVYRNTDVILAPGCNIKRSALCGRNFEYFSEDPYHAGILASSWINGVETYGIGTSLKHFACNNQEYSRLINSTEVSLRALREIYVRSFEYTLKYSSPATIMVSYNKLNGIYTCENEYLLTKVLRDELKYDGLLISDWNAVDNKLNSINAGLDVEMPYNPYKEDYLKEMISNPKFNEKKVDDHLDRLIKVHQRLIDKRPEYVKVDFEKQYKEAVDLAKETIVLVKNEDNILPLDFSKKTVVYGYFNKNPHFQGGGSANTVPMKFKTFDDVLRERNVEFLSFEGYEPNNLLVSDEELNAAKDATNVIVFIGGYDNDESEGGDRVSIDLHSEQIELIKRLYNVNKNIIAIVETGAVLSLKPILNMIKGLLISYAAGEGINEALYLNISGENNPSGRLCETWIDSLDSNPLYDDYCKNIFHAYYDEDIYVGYRYYDKINQKGVIYPFGYGLSYGTVSYLDFKVNEINNDEVTCTARIRNNSYRAINEILQVYVSKENSNVYREFKALKYFEKVRLAPNQEKEITFILKRDAFEVFDIDSNKFVIEKGLYTLRIGSHSLSLPLECKVTLDGVTLKEKRKVPVLTRHRDKEYEDKLCLSSPITMVNSDPEFIKICEKYLPNSEKWILNCNHDPLYRGPLRRFIPYKIMKDYINRVNNRNVSVDLYKGVAHRGLHNDKYPENSLAAFKHALYRNFAFELDVHITKDEKVVVIHDSTLDRVCKKEGIVEKLTYKQLKDNYTLNDGSSIPLLEDVLDLNNEMVLMVIELKTYENNHVELARQVKKVLKRVKDSKKVHIISFDSRALDEFEGERFARGLLINYGNNRNLELMNKYEFIDVEYSLLADDRINGYFNEGGVVLTWTIRDFHVYKLAKKMCSGVTFENIDYSVL